MGRGGFYLGKVFYRLIYSIIGTLQPNQLQFHSTISQLELILYILKEIIQLLWTICPHFCRLILERFIKVRGI